MPNHTSKLACFARAGLVSILTASPIAAQADPLITTLTGHHDGHAKTGGNGENLGSFLATDRDFYLIASPDAPPSPGQARVYATTFNNNNLSGLAVLNGETVTVSDGQFNNNTSGLWFTYSHGTIQNGQFNNNRETGIEIDGKSLVTINGGEFSDNQGPGLVVHSVSTAIINGGTFSGNQYGLYTSNSANVHVTNATFSGNTQADLWADGGTITLTGTFRQNGMPYSGTLTDTGSFEVLFANSSQWQTLQYKTTHGGKIVLVLPLK